ncbi:uncharacterized protein METZ01_LOCUS516068 [marine metagenome]|uniref:Uncharacterized protein n=1 Tax=marine metagenome TaxID=408172 RepID=A0A383F2X0_9ZZZZ
MSKTLAEIIEMVEGTALDKKSVESENEVLLQKEGN